MTRDLPTLARPLKIGTRGSPLALAQAHETRTRLMAAFDLPEAAFEIVVIKTTGDKVQDRPLKELGGKGLFTKEIEEALLASEIDIAVHSMKDMPTRQPAGLVLDCYLPREDPRDAFVSFEFDTLAALPQGATIGTSSLRRKAQLLHKRPDLNVVEFRGNVQTRMRKLNDRVAVATFLAAAGLNRLNAADVPAHPIETADMLPAVAQGAIGIERRIDDQRVSELLQPLHHKDTATQLAAERAFLATLDGSCQTPIAGLAELNGRQIALRGEILSLDGRNVFADAIQGSADDAASLGQALAETLLQRAGPGFFAH